MTPSDPWKIDALLAAGDSHRVWLAAALVIGLGCLGVLVITGLCVAWRNYNKNLTEASRSRVDPDADPWTIAGQRLITEDWQQDSDPPTDPQDDQRSDDDTKR